MQVPQSFAQRMAEVHGDAGRVWVEQLPALIAEYARRWSLEVGPAFEPLSYNFVAPALRAGGSQAVLKMGVTGSDGQLEREIAALQLYGGQGMVQLLEADPQHGVMLLERLQPGTELWRLDDDEQATSIAAEVMRQLWQPVPENHPFPTAAAWAAGLQRLRARFDGGSGPFAERLVAEAERRFAELLASAGESVLLHADLHHYNILAAQRQPWLAIDPQGLAGEREYEVGAFLRNPGHLLYTWPDLPRITARRIAQFAEQLGFDRRRLRGWGMAQAVLSDWWYFEDHGRLPAHAGILAQILSELPGD